MSKKIDITKIKLFYRDTPGTGKELFASLGQEIPCVEFTMKSDVPQPITYTGQQHEQQHYLFSERWIQFEPAIWTDMVKEVFEEMVEIWNEKYHPEEKE